MLWNFCHFEKTKLYIDIRGSLLHDRSSIRTFSFWPFQWSVFSGFRRFSKKSLLLQGQFHKKSSWVGGTNFSSRFETSWQRICDVYINRSTLIFLPQEFCFQKTNLRIAQNKPILFLYVNARENIWELTIPNLWNPLSYRISCGRVSFFLPACAWNFTILQLPRPFFPLPSH